MLVWVIKGAVPLRSPSKLFKISNLHRSQGLLLSVLLVAIAYSKHKKKDCQIYWKKVSQSWGKSVKESNIVIWSFFQYHWQRIASPSIMRTSQGCRSKRRPFFSLLTYVHPETRERLSLTLSLLYIFLTNRPLMFKKKYEMRVDVVRRLFESFEV